MSVTTDRSTLHEGVTEFLTIENAKEHPFLRVNAANADYVAENYLAMSIAFPYLQAGSVLPSILSSIKDDVPIPAHVDATSVVGSFLVWDEFGGHGKVLAEGNRALPGILETSAFHAKLLSRDLDSLFGRTVTPSYSPATRRYLLELLDGLSHPHPLVRCAWMVSFEGHAERMIRTLWKSIVEAKGGSRDSLAYFVTHVGGDDPAEAYHMEMTQRLLDSALPVGSEAAFMSAVGYSYRSHVDWCASLVDHQQTATAA